MSTFKPLALVSLIWLLAAGSAFAFNIHRADARREITATRYVIIRAHRAVNQGRVFTGDLALAVRHQRFAISLFKAGEFERSFYQTIRARRLAYAAIRANKGAITRRELAEIEVYNAHSDEELDADFQKNGPQESIKDEDVVSQDSAKLDIDIVVK